jgi:hypothetical protein
MCEMFIKHVLGIGTKHHSLYGDTSAYYGTIEQQGRLTLQMHLLLWIKGALTPQEIQDKIMDPTSDFQKKMIEYLESVHIGEFMTGEINSVKERVNKNIAENKDYKDPTQTLLIPPPLYCEKNGCQNCDNCEKMNEWNKQFENTVDDILLHSNAAPFLWKMKRNKRKSGGCLDKSGNCRARFPRETFNETQVDPNTGTIKMKKK